MSEPERPVEPPAPEPLAPEPPRSAEPTEPVVPPAAPAAPVRRSRSGWFAPLATGLAGLALGLIIGATVVGLIATIALHHRRPAGFGDGRGHHWQDNRQPPWRR